LLRALLLQAFYTMRSERQLMEQLDYNLLFRWFVELSIDDPVWDAMVFSKNRDRLLDGDVAAKFFAAVLKLPQVRKLLSSEHFSVDGMLIEAWASMKSFVPKDGGGTPPTSGSSRNAERDFHGEERRNDTHSSITDPDAPLTESRWTTAERTMTTATASLKGADRLPAIKDSSTALEVIWGDVDLVLQRSERP
jgi:hypothetical protein